jgi:hypothetical protein
MDAGDFIVIDIETTGGSINNIPEGFQLLVTGSRRASRYSMYSAEPESLDALASEMEHFEGPIVTFNGTHFDLPILDRCFNEVLGKPLVVQRHYDLMLEVMNKAGRRISLDLLSFYTYGEQKMKLAHHKEYGRIWESEPWRMIEYNKRDLDLTHELFMRVLRGEPLFLGDATVILDAPR